MTDRHPEESQDEATRAGQTAAAQASLPTPAHAADEPWYRLVADLVRALVRYPAGRGSRRWVNAGITLCGVVVLVTPLALWIAWSKAVMIAVLVAAACAALLIRILVWLSPDTHI